MNQLVFIIVLLNLPHMHVAFFLALHHGASLLAHLERTSSLFFVSSFPWLRDVVLSPLNGEKPLWL
jgi:hypothetical protein